MNQFTSVIPFWNENIYIKAQKIMVKTCLNLFLSNFEKQPKKQQNFKVASAKTDTKGFKKQPIWLQVVESGSTADNLS